MAGEVNSLRPRDVYMCHYTWLSLVHIMASALFSTKPSSEPILWFCQLDPCEDISMTF